MANRSKSSFIPVVVAFVAIAGFFGWLAMSEPENTVTVTEPVDSAAVRGAQDPGAAAETVVTAETLQQSAEVRELLGQPIRVEGVAVAQGMGPQIFWIQLPNGSPYMVKLDSALVAAGTPAPTSGTVTISGQIRQKDAAVLDQWMQSGTLQSENQKIQAEFGTTYFEARRVQPAGT